MNAPNEEREETVEEIERQFEIAARKLIANSPSKKYRVLSNDEYMELRDQLSEQQQQLDATLRNTTRLLDQLSKEREFNEKLKQGLENGSERWKKHLELENNTLKEQLAKEREMRKELMGYVIAYRGLASLTSDEDIFIGSLIKRASELDKT